MGGKSKKTKQTQTTILDPQTQALNALRLGQEQAMEPLRAASRGVLSGVLNPGVGLPGTQGLPAAGAAYLAANPDVAAAYGPNATWQNALEHYQTYGQREGRAFGDPNAAPTMLRPAYRLSTGETVPGIDANKLYASLPGLQNMQFASPEEAFAASRLAALTDVSGLEGAARTHLDQIVAPQLMSQAIAQGMGRSGGTMEALAKQGAQFALPIEQARMGAEQNLAQFVSSRGERRQALAGGLAQPSTPFMPAPTTTTTVKGGGGKGGGAGSILGALGTVAGSFFGPVGGALGGMAGSALGSAFGGGGGGGGPGGALLSGGSISPSVYGDMGLGGLGFGNYAGGGPGGAFVTGGYSPFGR